MRFMRIISQEKNPAAFNMALDEAVSEAVRQRLSPPTLRLYQWDAPSVTIGYFQKVSDVNTIYCTEKGYPVVRRITGGRALLHDAELTYSVSSPTDFFPSGGGLFETYTIISKALIKGLAALGINARMSSSRKRTGSHRSPACLKSVSYGEVTAGDSKIIGSAQKRYHDGFLQQGSILPGYYAGELSSILNGCKEDFRESAHTNGFANTISLADMRLSLKEAFEKELRVKMIADGPSKFELNLASELEVSKYANRQWNFAR